MRLTLVILASLLSMPLIAMAQTDEIQVYDAEIADQGVFNLMVHTNFTPIGRETPVFFGRNYRESFCERGRRMGVRR